MGISESNPVIVGFDFSGDDMLRGELLALEQGLTVLYGLNGTGKSRLLRGIRGALLGVQTDVNISLIARATVNPGLDEFNRGQSWYRPTTEPRPFALAVAQELADPSDYFASPGQRSSERQLKSAQVEAVITAHIVFKVGREDPELKAEVLEDRFFLLAPTGTEDAPSWAAYAVADASRPAAQKATAQIAKLEETFPNEEDFEDEVVWDDEVDAHNSRMADAPVMNTQGFVARGPRKAWIEPAKVTLYEAGLIDLDFEEPMNLVGPIDFSVDVLDLERDAVNATNDYIAQIVAGSLQDAGRFEENGAFDGTFPLGNPERVSEYWRDLEDERRANAHDLVERTITEAADQLGERVTSALGDVLLDHLVARLEVAPPALRAAVPSLEWRFHRASTDRVKVGLAELSKAERLWAERSINEAIYWHRREHDEQQVGSLRPVVYLLDEPEAALHRAAEAFMARSLLARAKDPRHVLMVATHSPELLDTTEARLIGLQHTQTRLDPTVRQLDLGDRGLLGELGLTPSDLLRWPRVLLLVEGLHDEVLLDHYLGDRLRAARVDVLVLRGGTRLPLTVDSRVLFEHTEAHVVGLVDNEDAENLSTTWEGAQEAAVQGDTQAAIDIVLAGIPRTRSEADFIRDWLTGALRRGLDGRITPYALERADIIDYLPVAAFVPSATSWDALRAEHQAARKGAPKSTAREFKAWLRTKHAADFTEETLRSAAKGTTVPAEFEMLMKTLESISARKG